MRRCWLVLAVTLYLSLDVANPLMPGAVTFGSENSLELRQAERLRGHHDLVAPAPSFDRIETIADETAMPDLPLVESLSTASLRVCRVRSSLSAPPSSLEDH